MQHSTTLPPAGEGLKTEKMPGHWVLARLGKRVLRPGGMELMRRMLKRLAIKPSDEVIEFAPGMGTTARLNPCACAVIAKWRNLAGAIEPIN